MTKSRALNMEFLIGLMFPEPWNLSLCWGEDAPTQIICLHILLSLLTWRYQPKVPGRPASYTEAICSSVTPFLLTIYGTSTYSGAASPRRPPTRAADANDPWVALTSCEADLMRVEYLRWRLQTHLMAVEAPNYTHFHPYLGEATPPRHLRLWQRSCKASLCISAPVSRGCRVADPEPAAAFHLLARSTCFGLRCHLYMHRHRFYPAGSKNLSHLTPPLQQLLMINRRATSPPARTLRIRRLTADIWNLFYSA